MHDFEIFFTASHLIGIGLIGLAIAVIIDTVRNFIGKRFYIGIGIVAFVFLLLYGIALMLLKAFNKDDMMLIRATEDKLGLKTRWFSRIVARLHGFRR